MSFAEELFEADRKYIRAFDRLMDHALSWFGIDPEKDLDAPWPFVDVTHDYYDRSFELKGVTPGVELSLDARTKAGELGFDRCWLCYQDGSEMYYGLPKAGKAASGPGCFKPAPSSGQSKSTSAPPHTHADRQPGSATQDAVHTDDDRQVDRGEEDGS